MSPLDPGTDSLIGQTLDSRYQVEVRIGRGGMGDVYLARHLLLGSKVALKVLSGERAGDPNAARRFVREARSAFRVDHPHCVRVIDLGTCASTLYIAMEYLDGRTVDDELRADGPVASGRAAHVGRQVAAALAHAHGLGMVHRDLKPENIMLVRRGDDPDFVKVLDFGLARIFDQHGVLAGTAISLSPLTRHGSVFGTPEYMSPEQASGGAVGPESDIYALGAVLYHMVTGEVPFSGQTFTEILSRHVREAPVPPSARCPERAIAPALERLILDCLDKVPGRRPQGAAALGERLGELAAELGREPRQMAPEAAASETADLATSAVKLAAAQARGAETADLQPIRDPATESPRRRAALPEEWRESTLPNGAGTRPTRRGRRLVTVGAVAALGAGVAVAALSLGRAGSTSPVLTLARTRSADLKPGLDPEPPPVRDPSRTATPTPASAFASDFEPATSPASDPAAPGGVEPVAQGQSSPPRASRSAADRLRADRHVRAAEAARRSGNLLRQLAEADQAHRLDPENRRAVLLMGEALVKSGDRARGCPLLRRSIRLYRQVGCAD